MPKGRVATSDAEIAAMVDKHNHGSNVLPFRTITEARYLQGLDRIRIVYRDGTLLRIPRKSLQGLEGASRTALSRIEILTPGTGLLWPSLNVAFSATGLAEGRYGSPSWMRELERKMQRIAVSA